ncbi:MAG TPA: DoxX family protein [Terriglobales bacterium]|nr:DoxX family protein [Terriglobales bacterium]
MARLYSGFPGKAAGVGLLLLRIAVGGTVGAVLAGGPTWQQAKPIGVAVAVCLLVITSGACIVLGFLTRIAAVFLAGLASTVVYFSTAASSVGLMHSRTLGFNLVLIALAIAFLGPGAFSLDAVLFGRRRVIIPRPSASSGR